MVRKAVLCLLSVLALTSCNGSGVPLTGASKTERGESGAVNPARNITVACQDTKNSNTGVTVNITNNCTKNNVEGVPPVEGEE
jgi:hypothetical protein